MDFTNIMSRLVSTILRPYEPLKLFFCEDPLINKNDFVIVEGQNGLTLTQVIAVFEEVPQKTDPSSITKVVRKATDKDMLAAEQNKTEAKTAYCFCKKLVAQHNLEMKLIDVELTFDKGKLIFYYTAPTRIDFRHLIKDLIQEYRARIEMRQVGDRNETQILGTVGNCGMMCCCRRFLKSFTPVSIKMAKEQSSFLNPSKISGQCGKLICCLSYEENVYRDFHKKTPEIGKQYATDQGNAKVLRKNIFNNSITILNQNNEELEMNVDEWKNLNPAPASSKRKQHEASSKNFSEDRAATNADSSIKRVSEPME